MINLWYVQNKLVLSSNFTFGGSVFLFLAVQLLKQYIGLTGERCSHAGVHILKWFSSIVEWSATLVADILPRRWLYHEVRRDDLVTHTRTPGACACITAKTSWLF